MTSTTMRRLASVLALSCALAVPVAAQEASTPGAMQPITLVELVLNDGSTMFGHVQRESAAEIVFKTLGGATFTVRRQEIASLKTISGSIRNGEFLPPDPNTTRLFFAPTGRSLRRGQVYLGVYQFLAPMVQVGVTDRLSIGGGTPLYFGIEEWDRPYWVTPKLQVYDRHNTQIAVGVLHAFDIDNDGGGIAYTVVSRGTDVRAFTIGGGFAYNNDGGRAGVLMVGGEGRISRRVKAITENYIWEGGEGIATVGFRFFGERLSADLALAIPLGADGFVAVPIINFLYLF